MRSSFVSEWVPMRSLLFRDTSQSADVEVAHDQSGSSALLADPR